MMHYQQQHQHQHQQPLQAQQNQPKNYIQYLEKKGIKLGRTLGVGSYAKVKETEYYTPKRNEIRKMAVKIIDRSKAPKDFLQRFLPRELEIYQRIQHENIIKMYGVHQYNHKVFIFMEIAEGGDLLNYIKTNGPIPNSLAKRMFYELALAIQYLHSLHIAHRDLKCENILLDRDGRIKLGDFGFARSCMDYKIGKRVLCETYCGSVAYAAPEILKGQPYNAKLYDIWSLGVILFIMVCGCMPYDDKDVKKMLQLQLKSKLKFPSFLQDQSYPGFRDLLHSMLEVDVTKRYSIERVLKHRWLDEIARPLYYVNGIAVMRNGDTSEKTSVNNNFTNVIKTPSTHRRTIQ